MSAWIVRHGRSGEYEEWALTRGRAAVGWDEVGDLTNATTRELVRAAVDQAFPSDPPMRQTNFASQLWAIRGVIAPGE